jgi:uncharacterized membrane protein
LYCQATFDLTSLSLLKRRPVAVIDVSWVACGTAVWLTAGLLVAKRLLPKV